MFIYWQGEFLCPVCRGLANSVLPGDKRKAPQPPAILTVSSTDANNLLNFKDIAHTFRLQEALSLVLRAANIAGDNATLKSLPAQKFKIKPNLEPITRFLCGMYYPSQDKIAETGRVSHSLILWDTLKYSLMSTEVAARSRKSSLTPNYSLGALYKELNSSSGFILSLLLDVSQSTRSANYRTVLLRFQGIQLFARSLCLGTCPNGSSSYSGLPGGMTFSGD